MTCGEHKRKVEYILDPNDTLQDEAFGRDRSSFVKAADVHPSSKRNAEGFCTEYSCSTIGVNANSSSAGITTNQTLTKQPSSC